MTGLSLTETAVDRARRLKTYGKIDRSAQYEGEFDGLDGNQIRQKLQVKYDQIFANARARDEREFWHKLILLIIAPILARSPEIIAFLKSFL